MIKTKRMSVIFLLLIASISGVGFSSWVFTTNNEGEDIIVNVEGADVEIDENTKVSVNNFKISDICYNDLVSGFDIDNVISKKYKLSFDIDYSNIYSTILNKKVNSVFYLTETTSYLFNIGGSLSSSISYNSTSTSFTSSLTSTSINGSFTFTCVSNNKTVSVINYVDLSSISDFKTQVYDKLNGKSCKFSIKVINYIGS